MPTTIQPEQSERFDVKYSGICVDVGEGAQKKRVLHSVSGTAHTGELLAVMGPTGCGKTTLLNAISGRVVTSSGRVRYGEYAWSKAMKRRIGFVEQDDKVFAPLTVRETLQFAARLRLPSSMTLNAKLARVEEVIKALRLDKCADTVVGDALERGISGGERKRLAIGQEMLTHPRVLVLDEPTSGLDSSIALLVIQSVQELARTHNMACIASIHQPSSQIFEIFSRLSLLCDGKTVYHGAAAGAVAFFSDLGHPCPTHYNPPDHFMDLMVHSQLDLDTLPTPSGNSSDVEQLEVEEPKPERGAAPAIRQSASVIQASVSERYAIGYWEQFVVLLERTYKIRKSLIFDSNQLFLYASLACLPALMFFRIGNDESDIFLRTSLLLMIVGMWMWFPFMNALAFFMTEEVMVRKELSVASFRLSAWFLAHVCVMFVVFCVWIPLWVTVVHFISGVNDSAEAWILLVLCILQSAAAFMSMGLAISAAVPAHRVMSVGIVVISFFFLYSGLFNPDMPSWLSWTEYLNVFSYGYQLAMRIEFDGQTFTCDADSQFAVCNTGGPITFSDIEDEYLSFSLPHAALMNFVWIAVGLGVAYQSLRYRLLALDREVLNSVDMSA